MTDFRDYFNSRITQEIEKNEELGISTKYDEVQTALTEKVASLEKSRIEREARRELNKRSWVTRLGLDPKSAEGRAVNIAASVLSGGSRQVLGTLASLPVDLWSVAQAMSINEDDVQAYNRYVRGEATEEDVTRLNSPKAEDIYNSDTVMQRIQKIADTRAYGRRITENTDINEIVHKDAREELHKSLDTEATKAGLNQVQEGWDQLKEGNDGAALANLAGGVGSLALEAGKAAVDNPQAAIEYIAENAPQLAAGAISKIGGGVLLATNAGYGMDLYQQGMEKFAKENNGALPPEDVRNSMAIHAAAAGAADHLGDKLGLALAKATGNSAKEITKTSIKEALLNPVKATTGGAASEAVTEGFQTYAEGEATLKPATAQEIYEGATIGGIAGGGMSGGARAVGEAVRATPEWESFRAKEILDSITQAKAIKTNNVSQYGDDPLKAVQVLSGHAKQEDTTPEIREENSAKIDEVISGLENERQSLYDRTPEGRAEIQTWIDSLSPEDKAASADVIETVQKNMLEDEKLTPAQLKNLKAKIERIDRQLASVRNVREDLTQFEASKIDLDAQVTTLNTPVTADDPVAVTQQKDAANKVITLAMVAPDRVSPQTATALADDTKNVLSTEQRTFLRSFSEARLAANHLKTMGQVSDEVFYGDPRKSQMGIMQYRSQIATAVRAGATRETARLMAGLSSFAKGHSQKANLITSLYDEVKGTGEMRQMVPVKGAGWQVLPELISREEVKKMHGFTIDANSKNLVKRIRAEADALQATVTEMKSVEALKKAPKTPQAPSVSTVEQPVQQTAVESNQSNVDSSVNTEATSTSSVKSNQTPTETVSNEMPKGGWPTETWGGMTVYPHIFVGMAPGDFKSTPLQHNPNMYEFSYVDSKNNRIAGTYWLDGTSIDDFNITSENGTGSVGIGNIRHILNKLIEMHPSVTELKGTRISGVRKQAQHHDVEVKFAIKNGKLVLTKDQEASTTPVTDDTELGRLNAELNALEADEKEVVELGISEFTEAYKQGTTETIDAELSKEDNDVEPAQSTEEQVTEVSQGEEGSPDVSGETDSSTATEAGANAGQLEVLSRSPADPGTFLSEISKAGKMFATYLKQSVQRDGDTSLRPLVAVQNFLSQLIATETVDPKFLPEKFGDGTLEERRMINTFQTLAPEWAKKIRESLVQTKEEDAMYRYKDPLLELLIQDADGKWDLPENVKTAMVYAGMSYLIEQSKKPAINNAESINKMLGRPADFEVLPSEIEMFGDVLARKYTVANALGQRAVQALGLKAKANAPTDFLPNLEAAIGNRILDMLVKLDVLTRVSVSNSDMTAAVKEVDETTLTAEEYAAKEKRDKQAGFSVHEFIKLTRDAEYNLSPMAERVVSASIGSRNVLDSLFSVDPGSVPPTLEPMEFKQKQTTRGQDVPKRLAQTLQNHNNQAHRLKQVLYHTFFGLSEDAQIQIASGEWVTPNTQAMLVDGIKARNEALKREIQNFREFVDYFLKEGDQKDPFKTPFYFQHDVWNQFRVGVLNNLINPQMSKVVRHLILRDGWESEVTFDNVDQMNNFKLRVFEALGVKTSHESNVDTLKRMPNLFLLKEERKVADTGEKFQKYDLAVDALVSQINGEELTSTQEQQIVAAVKEAGEKMLSYDGLVALAEYRWAKQQGQTSFKSSLIGEIDGVSNGPIMARMLFGAADNPEDLAAVLKKGGFYSVDDGIENYNDWRKQKGMADLYESMTISAFKVLEAHKANIPAVSKTPFIAKVLAEKYDAVQSFIGDLIENKSVTSAGRNLSKEPIRPLVFGSSKHRAIEAMAQSYIDSIAKTLQKLPDDPKARVNALQNLNKLLWTKEGGLEVPVNMSRDQLMMLSFTKEQRQAISKAFTMTFGRAYSEAIDNELGTFLERRNQITRATELSFVLYNSVREALREEFIQDLINKGELDFYVVKSGKDAGKKKPRHELTAIQEREFQKSIVGLMPMVHTPMSLEEGSLQSALPGFINERQISDNLHHRVEIHFADKNAKGFRAEFIYSTEKVISGPGVNLTSMPIHAFDSEVSHTANAEGKRLNLHDANATGLDDFTSMGQDLNKALWDSALNYSPIKEVADSLERTVQGVAALLQRSSKEMTTEQRNALLESIAKGMAEFAAKHKMNEENILSSVVGSITYTALNAERNKLSVMANTAAVDQYASEGSRYLTTEADRAEAAKRLAEAEKRPLEQPKTTTSIDLITNMAESKIAAYHNKLAAKTKLRNDLKTLHKLSVGEITQALRALIMDTTVDRSIKEAANTLRKAFAAPDSTLRSAQTASKLSSEKLDAVLAALSNRLDNRVLPPTWVIGQPNPKKNDPNLVKLFERRESIYAKQMLEILQGQLSKNENGAFYQMLAKRLVPLVGDNLKIVYVTKNTDPAILLSIAAHPSHGWYSINPETNKEEIYIMGQDFRDSAINAELLLHEMTHAALLRLVSSEEAKLAADPNYTSDALTLIQELKAMQNDAKALIDANPALRDMQHGVADIHEFIAWGLTNKQFQDRVLKQLSVSSPTGLAAVTDGFKVFVKKIVGLIMGNTSSKNADGTVNAMAIFLRNTAALMESVTGEERASSVMTQSQRAVQDYTTTDLFDALDEQRIQPEFADHLRGLLSGMVERLFPNSAVIGDRVVYQQAPDIKTAWTSLRRTNAVNFATESATAGFSMSAQEAFASEHVMQAVKASLDREDAQTTQSYKELVRLYKEVRDVLNPNGSDFNTGNPAQDQALYDFIFKMEAGADGRADYLARFATLGLTNQAFNTVLNRATSVTPRTANRSFQDRLTNWVYRILDWIGSKITHTYQGQQANEKLEILMENLVHIEESTRARMAADPDTLITKMEDKLTSVARAGRTKIGDLAQSNIIKNSRSALVQLGGKVVSTIAHDRVDQVMNAIEAYRDRHFKEHQGIVAGLINEIRGSRPNNLVFYKMLRASKHLEGLRKGLITNTSKIVTESFTNNGQDLTHDEKKAITGAFLRTDLSALLDSLGMSGIRRVLNSKSALASEINQLEAKLNAYPVAQHFYIKQAKLLGYYMATGKVRGTHMLMNAYAISRALGTRKQSQISEADARAAAPIIDQLASLYALRYTEQKYITDASNLLNREMLRGTENGVEMVLKLHRQFQNQSKERLFQNADALMMKGYTPEIYNPHNEIVVADIQRGRELEALGYERKTKVQVDPNDPDQTERYIYMLAHGGLRAHLTGIFSYTGKRAKGSRAATDEVTNLMEWQINMTNLATMNTAKQAGISRMFDPDPTFDPSTIKTNYAAPVIDPQGKVKEYRYLMYNETKDALLERDNRFDVVLGALAGSIFDKETSKEQNRKAVQALYEQYQAEYSTRSDSYVVIDETSTDPEYREIYRLLPEDTKQAIRDIWGERPMRVRVDLLDINFGYRKASLSTLFDKDPQNMGFAEQAFVSIFKYVFDGKAALRVRQAEDVFQEIVRETKDILVVKTGLTLLGNVSSNFTLLGWHGVPARDILHHHKVAMRGIMAYRKDMEALEKLRMQRESGYVPGNSAEIDREIIRLTNEINRNPVKKLIDAGLMPTIVEDVASEEDIYSYKTLLVKKVQERASRLNPSVIEAGKMLYMAKDTKMYKALSYGTQVSDFLARYTLYQYLITKAKDPMAHEEAVQLASDAFVNYDIPSHRTVQYLNDMGIVWFTKYYLRIQKVIARLYAENPGRALMLLSLSHYFSNVPTLIDSSFINRMHNPFSIGAFKYPGILDELATVKVGMSPFN